MGISFDALSHECHSPSNRSQLEAQQLPFARGTRLLPRRLFLYSLSVKHTSGHEVETSASSDTLSLSHPLCQSTSPSAMPLP